jgi:hypothetical protein
MARILRSTNTLASMMEIRRDHAANVKCWRTNLRPDDAMGLGAVMLLFLVNWWLGCSGALQESVELAGEGALEAAADVALALAWRCGGWCRSGSAHDGSGGSSRWCARPDSAGGHRHG